MDREFCKKFAAIEKVTRMRLDRLNAATSLTDLSAIPGHRRIRINDQFRVCFEWKDGDAWNVEVVDYH